LTSHGRAPTILSDKLKVLEIKEKNQEEPERYTRGWISTEEGREISEKTYDRNLCS